MHHVTVGDVVLHVDDILSIVDLLSVRVDLFKLHLKHLRCEELPRAIDNDLLLEDIVDREPL